MRRVYLFQRDLAEARWLLGSVTKQAPRDAESWYWAGVISYRSENYIQARDFFKKSIEISPDQSAAYVFMGQSHAAEGDYRQSIEWYESVLEIAPRDGLLLGNIAQAQLLLGRYQEAFDFAMRGMEADPRTHLQTIAARAAMKLADWSQARDLIENAVTLDPDNITYGLNLTEICIELDDFYCAKNVFQNVLRINPVNPIPQQGLTVIGDILP